jgi:hypothetical protein
VRRQVTYWDSLPRFQRNATVKLARNRHLSLTSLGDVLERHLGPGEAAFVNETLYDLALNQNAPRHYVFIRLCPANMMEDPHHQDGRYTHRRKPKSVIHTF